MSYDIKHHAFAAITVFVMLATAGCARNDSIADAGEQQQEPPPAEASPSKSLKPAPVGQLVELAVQDPANEAFLLGTGGTLSGTLTPIHDGLVQAVAVQVGTFSHTADGSLSIKLCPQAAKCVEGLANVDTFEDNGYAILPLSGSVNLMADVPVAYSITRTAGDKAFAVWTYPASAELTLPDGAKIQRMLKFALKY